MWAARKAERLVDWRVEHLADNWDTKMVAMMAVT
jgi:hypothetical protein